ncbi:uncharacterized protein [Nicotiana tomentosiformis]|uniref:uncharacterized protein n=1 Tax=Nicotiana tomentosiformis TaxID=4098 RepID=UPI00388C859E
MLRKDAATSWTEECQKAFDKIKEYLSKPPVLVPPEPGRPLLLYLSMFDRAFGCVLGQHDEIGRKEKVIYYLSKKFTPYEARYSLLECTHCALTWKAVKGQALADHLAENPVDREYEPLKLYFPDEAVSFVGEDIIKAYDDWRMLFDEATNFKEVGIKAVLVSETNQHYPVSAKLRFPCTNNMAKYEACFLGLRLAIDMNVQELLELIKRFTRIEFKHVPRIQNEFADALATLSSMIQHPNNNFIDPIPIGIHKQPTYCVHVKEEFDGNP